MTTSTATSPAPSTERNRDDLPLPWLLLGTVVAYLPLAVLGYGTDLDVAAVLGSGDTLLEGDYVLTRHPGAVPYELATGALDRVGGFFLVNAAGVALALLALWCVHRLLTADGARWPGWATLALAANPWFWLASASLGETTWALSLGLAGALAASRDRRVLAGLLFGVAIGCRSSTVLLVVAWLVAERTGAPYARRSWPEVARTAGIAVVVGAICFVPPWLSVDRTFDFLHNQIEWDGFGVHLGRWAVKNLATATVPAVVVLVLGSRHIRASFGRWGLSPVVRFAVVAIVLQELLFFRLPVKPVHLVPVVAMAVLLAGAARIDHRRWLMALAAAQLLAAAVGTTLAAPDRSDDADGGRISLRPADGVIVNDARCRLTDLDRGEWVDGDSAAEIAEATARAAANWECQRDAWRNSPEG